MGVTERVRDADDVVWQREPGEFHNWYSPDLDMWADWCDLEQPVAIP